MQSDREQLSRFGSAGLVKACQSIKEGLDENIGNGKQRRHHDREDDLGKDDRSPTGAWNVTRHLIDQASMVGDG